MRERIKNIRFVEHPTIQDGEEKVIVKTNKRTLILK